MLGGGVVWFCQPRCLIVGKMKRAESPSQVTPEYEKMNDDERAAYDEAVREIEYVRQSGEKSLDLSGRSGWAGIFDNLTVLPPEIAALTKLSFLDIDNTQISDITPLRYLIGLQNLNLSNTKISDVTTLRNLIGLQVLFLNDINVRDLIPLRDLTDLRVLHLRNTQVSDIAPLRALTGLRALSLGSTQVSEISHLRGPAGLLNLYLSHTPVTDLRPILKFPTLNALSFEGTPFAAATEKLTELAQLGADDKPEECAEQTIAYLKTLPPWPEPLPWEVLAHATIEKPKTPSALRPRATKLKKILREDPAGFAAHVQNSVAMLQAARAREAMSIPNDPDALAEWKTLTTSLTVAEDTLTVLHELIPDAPIPNPSQQDVSALAAALEAAAAKLRSGCAYLDKSTRTENGHHFAALHKIGVCSAVGSVFAFAAGSTLLVTLPAIATILYGKDFAKSATSIFKGGV